MIKKGETFVGGRSKEQARRLLDAAERLGASSRVVRTASDGYVVPTEVAELAAVTELVPQWSETTLVNKHGETAGVENELTEEPEPEGGADPGEPEPEQEEAEDSGEPKGQSFDYLEDMSLNQLRAEAGKLGLPAGGGKEDLRERIKTRLTNEGSE